MPLQFYKVQYAYSKEIGSPSLHKSEQMAKGEAAHLLGNWIMKNLDSYWRMLTLRGEKHPEFIEAAKVFVPEILGLLEQGLVWEAYNRWHDFYDRFENEFGFPLFVAIGTVLVETRDPKGPVPRRPIMRRSKVPPMIEYGGGREKPMVAAWREEHEAIASMEALMHEAAVEAERRGIEIKVTDFNKVVQAVSDEIAKQFQDRPETEETLREFHTLVHKGVLSRLFGASLGHTLGAITSWLVQYADFGGIWHPGRHTSERRAKVQAEEYLRILMHHLKSQTLVHRDEEVEMAMFRLIEEVESLLDQGLVWKAYLTFKEFENEQEESAEMFPLQMRIGTMRVTPEPVAEDAG